MNCYHFNPVCFFRRRTTIYRFMGRSELDFALPRPKHEGKFRGGISHCSRVHLPGRRE
jgi:hypothetical protein